MLLATLNKDEEDRLGLTNEQIEVAKSEKRNPFSASLGWVKGKGQGLLAPFKSENFGANNPELGLLRDQETKAALQRSSMMAGLGAAGQALLANSGKSTGQAFGAGAKAFQEGADSDIQKGVLVDDKRVTQIEEAAKRARLDTARSFLTPEDQRKFDVANDTGNAQMMSSLYEESLLIQDINPEQWFPASVEAFRKTVKDGKPNYGVLVRYDPNGAGSGGGNSVSIEAQLYKQAQGQYGKYDPATDDYLILEGREAEMQALYSEASRMVAMGEATVGDAIRIAGEKMGIVALDEKGNPLELIDGNKSQRRGDATPTSNPQKMYPKPNQDALGYLKKNPKSIDEFEKTYGYKPKGY